MADEFVDFYEILELPLDADRALIRKRINELYVEAQRNLDHRNFATRVKFQQLFEVFLPQARYILLDEGRRTDYDLMVRDVRAPAGTAPAPRPASKPKAAAVQIGELGQTSGFKLTSEAAGQAPEIEELPPDPEAVAREREETWKKWKAGLQSAMEREAARETSEDKTEIRAQVQPAPQSSAPDTTQTVIAPNGQSASVPPKPGAPNAPPRPGERAKVKFDFGGENEPDNTPRRGESAPVPGAEEFVEGAKARLTPEEIERRRTTHRMELTKSELTDVGVKGSMIGAGAVLVPGVIAMVIFMSHYYPSGEPSQLALPSGLAWTLWLVFLGVAAFLASHFLSKSMRRKSSMEMTLMSYEELLRHLHKDY